MKNISTLQVKGFQIMSSKQTSRKIITTVLFIALVPLSFMFVTGEVNVMLFSERQRFVMLGFAIIVGVGTYTFDWWKDRP